MPTGEAVCGCCELTPVRPVDRDHDDKRPLHCRHCREQSHQQFAVQRDQDHRRMWKQHHDDTVARMTETIVALREELADPHEQVREATERAESAYRTRDRALRAMSYIEELHHAKDAKSCTCGKPQSACTEFRAADSIRDLIQPWEKRNRERMESGKSHTLPIDHPLVEDRWARYDWQGAPGLG